MLSEICTRMSLSAALALLGLALGAEAAAGSHPNCASFAPNALTYAAFSKATHYPANVRVNISNAYSSIDVSNLPAFCRDAGAASSNRHETCVGTAPCPS